MALRDTQKPAPPPTQKLEFTAAEIGALAHLYRGEVYRSTAWRTRLDSTTNWAVVTTGIALSATFSSAQASPLPMVLVGLIVSVFLLFEARRYRYFNVWRARARLLETDFYAPMIRGEGIQLGCGLGSVAGEGLLRSALPYQLRPRDRSSASPHIRVDLCDPSRCVLRQACHPPGTAGHTRRPLGTCRHWSDPRWPGRCCGSAIPWRMGGARARYVSHRDRLATRAAEPDCDGIAD